MNLVNKEYHKRARILLENWKNNSVVLADWAEPDPETLKQSMNLCLFKADASISEVNKLCKEAKAHNVSYVTVTPAHVERCVRFSDGKLAVAAFVGFPLGANHPEAKVFEAALAATHGAQALELVLNVGLLKTSNFQEVFEELRAVRYACPEVDLTVIIETGLLDPIQTIIGCMLCREAGIDDVKTATGLTDLENQAQNVSLMRFVLGEDLGIIASGGIESREMALKCLQAGASGLCMEYLAPGKPLMDILNLTDPAV